MHGWVAWKVISEVRGAMYARPPTISQLEYLLFIFTYIVALEIDYAREKVQATTTSHTFPYQLPTKREVFILPYPLWRPAWLKGLYMLSSIAICRPDGVEYQPVWRKQAPGSTAQLVAAEVASWDGLILTHCMVEKVFAESSNHIGGDEVLVTWISFLSQWEGK